MTMQDNPQPSSLGVIYKITNTNNSKTYIGQTRNNLTHRWYQHKQCAKRLLKYGINNKRTKSIRHSILYNAMVKYGIHTFHIETVYECDTVQLNQCEMRFINEYKSLVPNGYNLKSSGLQQNHALQTIALISSTKCKNINSIRNPKLHGLPPKVAYRCDGIHEYIVINNHRLCKYKTFSTKTFLTFQDAKEACLKFLSTLELLKMPFISDKKNHDNSDCIKGMCLINGGYRVNKRINSKTYDRKFTQSNLSMDEKKLLAMNYLNKILNCAVQRLNGDG